MLHFEFICLGQSQSLPQKPQTVCAAVHQTRGGGGVKGGASTDAKHGQGGQPLPGQRCWPLHGKGGRKPLSKPYKVTRLQWEASLCQVERCLANIR